MRRSAYGYVAHRVDVFQPVRGPCGTIFSAGMQGLCNHACQFKLQGHLLALCLRDNQAANDECGGG